MSRNGSGVYTPPAADYPAVASTLIESAKYNNVVDDIATALTGSIAADGQTTITANIPMNNKKLTGLAAGATAGDSVRYEQLTKESIVGLTTADSPQFAGVNLGHASDTTFTRVSAGVAAIEGVNILTTATGAAIAGSTGQAFSVSTLNSADTTDSTSSTTGAIKTAGGLGVAKRLTVGTKLCVATDTATTNMNVLGLAAASAVGDTTKGIASFITDTASSGVRLIIGGSEVSPYPMWLQSSYAGSAKQLDLNPSGGLVTVGAGGLQVTAAVLLGYGTGAGGTVTQTTSKSTAVTLNKPCGQITMDAAALTGGSSPTYVNFTLNNSLIAATDTVDVEHSSAGGTSAAYTIDALTVSAGAVVIRVGNISGGSLSEALVINFGVNKRVTS